MDPLQPCNGPSARHSTGHCALLRHQLSFRDALGLLLDGFNCGAELSFPGRSTAIPYGSCRSRSEAVCIPPGCSASSFPMRVEVGRVCLAPALINHLALPGRSQHLLEEPFSLFIQTTLWIKQSQLNVKPNLSLDADNHFNNISPFVPKHQGNKAFLLSGSVRLQLV